MVPEAHRLHAALVAAFPGYVTGVFAERGYPLDRASVEAIEQATIVLDGDLTAELELPFREQRRGPLELFRSACRLTSKALEDRGIVPLQTQGLMGEIDPYGVVPGSPSALGPEAHEAHLAWGTAKAAAFMGETKSIATKPRTLILAADRSDRERLIAVLGTPGVQAIAARNPAAVDASLSESEVVAAVVDVGHRAAREAIARLTAAGTATYVYGEGIDDLTEIGLLAQGVREVVERAEFVANPRRYVPTIT